MTVNWGNNKKTSSPKNGEGNKNDVNLPVAGGIETSPLSGFEDFMSGKSKNLGPAAPYWGNISHTVENIKDQKEAHTLLEQVQFASGIVDYMRGGVLQRIKDECWHVPHKSFAEFCEQECGYGIRKAEYLIKIYNVIVEAEISHKELEGIGWSRLRELASRLEPDEIADWLPKAKKLTVKELQEALKSENDSNFIKSDITTIKLRVHEDQKETIEAALQKSKDLGETKYDSVALEYICLESLAGGSIKRTNVPTLTTICEKTLADNQGDAGAALDKLCKGIEVVFSGWTVHATKRKEPKITLDKFGFGPASENEAIVYGAAKPAYSGGGMNTWIKHMQDKGIKRVVCLLPSKELGKKVPDLLEIYEKNFGAGMVLHAPISDFKLGTPATLKKIYKFLSASDKSGEKVVVHCSAGIGRTGHVLAGWLVHGRGFNPEDAIKEAETMGRNPREAPGDLLELLGACVAPFKQNRRSEQR